MGSSVICVIHSNTCILPLISPLFPYILYVRELLEVEERLAAKEKKVSALGSATMNPTALKDAVEEHNSFRSAWVGRRRKCMDLVEMLADSMERKVKTVMVCRCV